MDMAQAISRPVAEMNNSVVPPATGRMLREIRKTISSCSSRRWLQKPGFKWKEVRKEVYNDGHECDDVKKYWNEIFLPFLKELHPALMKWDQDLCPISNQQLLSGELAPVVMVTQDECTFNANNGRHCIWIHEDHQPLRKKGRG